MKNIKGFTLIELLVVIAVIALLMAIMLPALHTAKKLATGSVCLSNQKGLITAWIMYADNNRRAAHQQQGLLRNGQQPEPMGASPQG